jgi:O-antigen/teichoic acid export membrane protein
VIQTENEARLGAQPHDATLTLARNVSTRYLAIGAEMAIGILLLPFNVAHLGTAAYGLWMLTTAITTYFSVLDLGYPGALVKFVAEYRARRDGRALNEILSTTFYLFTALGVVMYLVAIVVAFFLDRMFHLSPEQVYLGRIVLLVVSVNVAAGMAFTVFGGVINGFQRYDLNNIVGTISTVVIAIVNVLVLVAGYGLVELVLATTAVRLLTYWMYRANAYRVFPGLSIRWSLFSRARLREVTTFSVYMALINWADKLNYSVDALVIGAFMNTSAVAVWAVGQRLAETTQRMTNQLNEVLFPTVVDNDTSRRLDRLRQIFLVGTRLSLATVVPIGGVVILMARPLVEAWVGSEFRGSVIVVQLLALTVIARVGTATAGTVLRGAGGHRLVAFSNIAAAFANLVLSIALVRSFGLRGVAIATLVPISVLATLVLFPAGCRHVHVTIWRGFIEAVWPAAWPAAVMAGYVTLTRSVVGDSLVAVGAEMVAAVLVYAITFLLVGVSTSERRFYMSKLAELGGRLRLQTPAVSEGA